MVTLHHPRTDDLKLEAVLAALGDPVRMALVRKLASCPKGHPMNCATTAETLKKLPPSTRTHHLRVLREAGVIKSERRGVEVFNTLRFEDVEKRFPGLLKLVLCGNH